MVIMPGRTWLLLVRVLALSLIEGGMCFSKSWVSSRSALPAFSAAKSGYISQFHRIRPAFRAARLRPGCQTVRALLDEEDDVKWLPPLKAAPAVEPAQGATVIPIFPLGSAVYVDLKEVSEMTGDAVKYVCDHTVIGRVRINKILNPSAWVDRSTYLKAEATFLEDVEDDPAQSSAAEEEVKKSYESLIDLQHEMEEPVKFTRSSLSSLNLTKKRLVEVCVGFTRSSLSILNPTKGEGLWTTVHMWQTFQGQRILARQIEMQQQFQEKLIAYLMSVNKDGALPSAININELPEALQNEVRDLQSRMTEDLAPLQGEDNKSILRLLEAGGHVERLRRLKGLIESEIRRLTAKRTLKRAFAT